MSFESQMREKNDHEKLVIKEEKLNLPAALDKKELTESEKNCHLLQDKKDTESLESIQNYAQRIKSFLGWESNLEEQSLGNELIEEKNEDVAINSAKAASGSFAGNESNVEGRKNCNEKLDCLNVITNSKDVGECETILGYTKNDSNLNIAFAENKTDDFIQKSEEKLIDSKINLKSEQYLTPESANLGMNLENNNIEHNLLDGTNETVNNENLIRDSKKDIINSSKIGHLDSSLNTNNSFILQEDFKENKSSPDEDIEDRIPRDINSDINISGSTTPEVNILIENQVNDTNVSQVDLKKDLELNKLILLELAQYVNQDECSKDKNNEIERGGIENSDLESKSLTSTKGENVELNIASISDLKNDVGKNNTGLPSEYTKDSDVDLLKEKNTNSEISLNEMIDSDLEKYFSFIKEKNQNQDKPTKELYSYECLTNDLKNGKSENKDADDLRSEDSLDFDSFKNNLKKNYVKEIRRLSRDIVRDVIETARNSVLELYTSKQENLEINSLPENLRNFNYANGSNESYLNNGKHQEEDASKFDKFSSNENFDCNSDKKDHVEQELHVEDKDTICGCGSFKPKWMQKYATPRAYLVLFSLIGVVHGCYYPYVVSILSTLEKRYAFKTKVSGTLLLADEITPLILGILVGYIGGKTHRPRMVAVGMFMSAACCFVSGIPYLIYGTTNHSSYFDDKYATGPKFCESGSNRTHCNIDEQPPTLSVVGLFLFASFLKGFATLSYYVIGISYMDDIIKRKNSPMYLAIALALRLLGPLVGFLMSSGFLQYYENPLYDPGFGPDDPRWIGAWWIGFFLQGTLLVIFTIPMAFFPRRLPSQKKIRKVAATASEGGLKETFGGLISALKRLGKNPIFIIMIINTTVTVFGHVGHQIMLPKYMENQFRISASEASLFSGAVSIFCIILSTLLGGFLIWKFRPRIKVLLGGMILSEIIICVGFLTLMIPKCQPSEMLHFGMDQEGLILNSACNGNCECSTSTFTPFCGQDGKTLYFSPCYAGCTEEVTSRTTPKLSKQFDNCSCVAQEQSGTTITEGFCPDENCWSQMIAYLIILLILNSVVNLFTVASTMILLRSVHPNDKSVALGTFETFICLFGFIPFPVTYGALVDSSCLIWEKSCGETGNCWFYDMEKYNYLLHGASALFSSLSVVCLITLYFLSSRIRDLYDEENEPEEVYVDIKLDTVSGSVTKL